MAKNLFERGKREREQKHYAEAAALFAASHEQAAKATPLALLADCYEQLGKLRSARDAFQEAAELALRSNNLDLAFRARTRAAALEPRIPRVELRSSRPLPEGLLLTLNGVELARESWSGAPLALDAGAYRLEASAPGYAPFALQFSLVNELARSQSVRVVAFELTPLPGPLDRRELAYWIGGAGAVVGAAGLVVWAVAESNRNGSAAERDRAKSLARWLLTPSLLSIPALGVAGWLYFTPEGSSAESALGVRWNGQF